MWPALGLAIIATVFIFSTAILAIKIREKIGEVEKWRYRAELARNKLGEVRREFEAEKVRIVEEAGSREKQLIDRLTDIAGRPPVIIDPSKVIREIGESISRITQGPPEAVVENLRLRQEVAERFGQALAGADPSGGVEFVPLAERDEWMNPGSRLDPDRPLSAVANGYFDPINPDVNLATGRPVQFRSGEGGEPPRGGWES